MTTASVGLLALRRLRDLGLGWDREALGGAMPGRFLSELARKLEEPVQLLPDEANA